MRRILATSALPYINGDVHWGTLLEHVQTDVWVRFQRLVGNQCIYVCAADVHGTATMIRAEADGITPEELSERVRAQHESELRACGVSYDNYYTTHSPENEHLTTLILQRLIDRGLMFTDEVEQLYDPDREIFLSDRYVKGSCPRCGAEDQHGDNCEVCSATYNAIELKNPKSVISDSTPVVKSSTHYFLDLKQCGEYLNNWIDSGTVQPEIANKLREWFSVGLKPWDMSRDEPYFGFQIPEATGKYLYVWFDAPIGYMASFKNWCDRTETEFDDFWAADSDAEVHHFIGKDVINFHGLFWPAMLSGSNFRTPTQLHTHGFLTINGEKMSKSRGTFIKVATYTKHLDPDYIRYYFAARLTATIDDIDFNFDDFVQRVNSDLIGKFVNIASRCAVFVNQISEGVLSNELRDEDLWKEFVDSKDQLARFYEVGDFNRAIRDITSLADRVNRYLTDLAPWRLAKIDGQEEEVLAICSMGINLFKILATYLKPVVPFLVERTEIFLNSGDLTWSNLNSPLLNHKINKYEHLLHRIQMKSVQSILDETKALYADAAEDPPAQDLQHIELQDFTKVNLRVAKITSAEAVEGADQLLRLTLDVGDHQRTVLSGIRAAYDPSELIGRFTIVVANLKPRTMRFGTSEGMVLAAGPGGKDVFLISPDQGVQPGMVVR